MRLIEAPERVGRVADEVRAGPVLAFLQHQHRKAPIRQLLRDHGAAGTRAGDDDVALDLILGEVFAARDLVHPAGLLERIREAPLRVLLLVDLFVAEVRDLHRNVERQREQPFRERAVGPASQQRFAFPVRQRRETASVRDARGLLEHIQQHAVSAQHLGTEAGEQLLRARNGRLVAGGQPAVRRQQALGERDRGAVVAVAQSVRHVSPVAAGGSGAC